MHVHDKGNNTLLITGCIISYPHLFEAKKAGKPGTSAYDQSSPKFSCNAILPSTLTPEDNALLASAHDSAVGSKFGTNVPANLKTPWKDGDDADPSMAGRIMISASTQEKRPPEVFSQHARMTPAESGLIFAGCVVDVLVRCYAYDTGTSRGVTFGLNAVKLVDNVNVTRLDGGVDAAAAFGIPEASTRVPAALSPTPNQPGPALAPGQAVSPGQPGQAAPAPTSDPADFLG